MKLQVPAAETEKAARGQRASLLAIAGKLERQESLSALEIRFAAAALRHVAGQIPTTAPPRRGVLDPGNLAILFAVLHHMRGYTKNRAYAELAETEDVSIQAMQKALKPHIGEALAMVPRTQPSSRNQTRK